MGILQARILEWLPCPPSGDLPNPGIKPRSPALKADSLLSELQEKPIYTEELYKKDLHDPDNHNGVITDLEPDILE